MVTWARLSQWVNPVQHEGFSRLPRSQCCRNAAVRCWPDIEDGSKSKTTNALGADRATLDKASPFAQVLWGPGLVTGDINRPCGTSETLYTHANRPPTGTTKGAKEVEVGQWGPEAHKCRKPAKYSTDRQPLPRLPFPNSNMHQCDGRQVRAVIPQGHAVADGSRKDFSGRQTVGKPL